MTNQPLKTIVSRALPLNRSNVDTDQIIPARFLKGTSKTGLGQQLFADWRYLPDGSPNPDFILNDPRYTGGRILVAAHNFGCGSSREHAPWALKEYGFQAILAISFADIFKNNALKNSLLPIALPEAVISQLLQALEATPDLEISIDVATQQVTIPGLGKYAFDLEPYRKTCILEGLDDIGYTLGHAEAITAFEGQGLCRG